jgi:hypothetical protein
MPGILQPPVRSAGCSGRWDFTLIEFVLCPGLCTRHLLLSYLLLRVSYNSRPLAPWLQGEGFPSHSFSRDRLYERGIFTRFLRLSGKFLHACLVCCFSCSVSDSECRIPQQIFSNLWHGTCFRAPAEVTKEITTAATPPECPCMSSTVAHHPFVLKM